MKNLKFILASTLLTLSSTVFSSAASADAITPACQVTDPVVDGSHALVVENREFADTEIYSLVKDLAPSSRLMGPLKSAYPHFGPTVTYFYLALLHPGKMKDPVQAVKLQTEIAESLRKIKTQYPKIKLVCLPRSIGLPAVTGSSQ